MWVRSLNRWHAIVDYRRHASIRTAAAHDLSTLRLAGIDDLDMLVAPAVQFLRRYPLAEHATPASAPLSDTEKRLLREGGLTGLDEGEDDERVVKASLASVVGAYAALVAGAYSAARSRNGSVSCRAAFGSG